MPTKPVPTKTIFLLSNVFIFFLPNDTFFRSDDYGFRLEDNYLIGKDGNEVFTSKYLEPIEL